MRGAYVCQEIKAASETGQPLQVFSGIEGTHKSFDACLQFLLRNLDQVYAFIGEASPPGIAVVGPYFGRNFSVLIAFLAVFAPRGLVLSFKFPELLVVFSLPAFLCVVLVVWCLFSVEGRNGFWY